VNPTTFFLSPIGTNPIPYDVVGRSFTVGARMKF
jgi:hypothetical protein